ncbi:DUF4870 domain-containing protein [Dokdonella ginsengisoli]|uniref:DUF4870 domain-containing protein n=1 Tax=Dokdonella ginsengisoli TaxID=363846 RepID=A0ABV9QTC6_9GAMM
MSETTGSPVDQPPVALSSDERTWALIGHLSAFSFFITGIGCVLGPLIVWLVKRDTLPFAGEQAKEALNFNITMVLAFVALVAFTVLTFGIGVVLTWPIGAALFIAWIVLTIIAAIKANEGVAYRYPFTLRLVS